MGNERSVSEMIPIDWHARERTAGVRLQFYTSLHEETLSTSLSRRAADAAAAAIDHPVHALFIVLDQPLDVQGIHVLSGYKGLQNEISGFGYMLQIPPGHYAVIMSPFDVFENGARELECSEALESMRGFLCATLGGSIANCLATTLDVPISEPGPPHVTSDAVIFPLPPSKYMFIEDSTIDLLKNAFTLERDPLWRERAEACLLFIGRSRRGSDARLRFFDLWTALEVYLGGPKAVAGMIDKGHRSPKWREQMKRLKSKRDDLVHKGVRHSIDINDERLICATIIRSICYRLKIIDNNLSSFLEN